MATKPLTTGSDLLKRFAEARAFGYLDTITGFQACTPTGEGRRRAWLTFEGQPATPDPATFTAQLVESASAQLTVPTIRTETSPPPNSEVPLGLPVWLWTQGATTATATASLPGITVTATATAGTTTHTITQQPPDDDPKASAPAPATVTCQGSTPYRPGTDDPWAESDCSFTFDQAGPATIESTTTWTLTWVSSLGASGDLGTTTRTTTTNLHPIELRASTR